MAIENNQNGSSAETLKVAYVVKMFPRLSETFIMNEILELERIGVEVTIFSIKRPNEGLFHPQLGQLKARTLYLDEFDLRKWPVWLGKHLNLLGERQENFWSLFQQAVSDGNRAKSDQAILGAWIATQALSRGVHRIHAHFATLPSTLAYYASIISGIDFSFIAHAKDIYVYPFTETLMLEKIAIASQLVTVTQFNKDYIDAKCPKELQDKVVVLHNGVDLDRFTVKEKSKGEDNPENLIVGVGRLVPKKGFDTLLRACTILKSRGINFKCVIIGDGSEQDALKALHAEENLSDVVELYGAAHSGETLSWIQKATVFCLPCTTASDNNIDALPTALLESLACGVPAVSTALSGIPEIIESGKEGFLVEPDEPTQLADKLELILKDPKLQAEMAIKCRIKAELEFDIKKNVGRLASMFAQSMRQSTSSAGSTSQSIAKSDEELIQQR